MSDNSQIFFNKKILVYGLGKSGLSSFNFLRNKNDVYLFDDNPNLKICLLYTSPSPRDKRQSRMPSSA